MANLNVEGLKEIYAALGGNLDDVENITTIPNMLSEIAVYAQAAAAELPAVKTADNGKLLTVVSGKWAKAEAPTELPAVTGADNNKVLTVVNGTWDKAAASGGNQFFIITASDEDDAIVLDKTYTEIETAFSSGKILLANYKNQHYVPVNYIDFNNNHPIFNFIIIEVSDGVTFTSNLQIDCESEYTAYNRNTLTE